jgi:hypothetical protein
VEKLNCAVGVVDLVLQVVDVINSLGENLPLGSLHAAVGRKSLAELVEEVTHFLAALALSKLVADTQLGGTGEGSVLLDGSAVLIELDRSGKAVIHGRVGGVDFEGRCGSGKSLGLDPDLGSDLDTRAIGRRADRRQRGVNVHGLVVSLQRVRDDLAGVLNGHGLEEAAFGS